MSPEAQDTATDIELRITRAAPPTGKRLDILPEPLADPIHDIRIKAATASAYLVRAGEWIQVIDVSGRQCTDFQALAARKVDKGLDYALDSTVTSNLRKGERSITTHFSRAAQYSSMGPSLLKRVGSQ